MDCHIRAFGACMIGGFPHRLEDSFFIQATERLRAESTLNLITSQFTFGGFPVPRVTKHLQHRCLEARPNVVVLQFATSDLVVPIRKSRNQSGSVARQRQVLAHPARLQHRLKWCCRDLLADLLQLPPVTQPAVYLQTMEHFAHTLLEHQIIPVVMSPFVFGGQRSNRLARDCTRQLGQIVASLPGAVFVDAYAALDQHPHHEMLLADGTHLSLAGHQVVADTLFPSLKKLLLESAK